MVVYLFLLRYEPAKRILVKQYYSTVEMNNARLNNVAARESSIQLVLQLILITHQYLHIPMSDFTFDKITFWNTKITASSQWIFGLVLQAMI